MENYLHAILSSDAYEWMIVALARNLLLSCIQGDDASARIRSEISKYLQKNNARYRIPAKTGPTAFKTHTVYKKHGIHLAAPWNPSKFLREEFPDDADIGRLLEEKLTLTGSATDAQMLPCSEYISQTWPETGPEVLAILKSALISGDKVPGKIPVAAFLPAVWYMYM